MCGPCSYDPTKLCSYVDLDGDGNPDGDPLPVQYRGFDDPQADPTGGTVLVQSVYVRYVRGDLYSLPPALHGRRQPERQPALGLPVGRRRRGRPAGRALGPP